MARRVVTVIHPDGTKKVIVGRQNNNVPTKVIESEEDKRAKPGTPKVGLTKERNGYKHGGKFKFKVS